MTITQAPSNAAARAGSILGLLALIFGVIGALMILAGTLVTALNFLLVIGTVTIWIPGLIAILGIIFSGVGLAGTSVKGDRPRALRGLILSIIAFVVPILALVLTAVVGFVKFNN